MVHSCDIDRVWRSVRKYFTGRVIVHISLSRMLVGRVIVADGVARAIGKNGKMGLIAPEKIDAVND